MKKTAILLVGAFFCLNICAKAQNQTDVLPLKVGEKLPETFWQQEHDFYTNGKLLRQNLSSYKGKLLILDFFATWCPTCINRLGKMDTLLRANEGKFTFLLVSSKNTGDNAAKIAALATRIQSPLLQTSVVNDSLFNKLFPHRTIPTYVWISEKGVLQSITNSDLLNQTSITTILGKKPITKKPVVNLKKAGK